jgi:Putative Se/S carrier protein-like
MSQGVVLFTSTHFAIRAEKLAKEKGLAVKLIPVPRHLSSDCGVCLRFTWDQKKEIENTLNQAGLQMEGIHCLG